MANRWEESFWGEGKADDFTSVAGFEAITNRLKDGKHSSESFETFLKSRAKLEQIYGKSLVELAKQCSDFNKSSSGTSALAWTKMQQSIKETGNAHTKAGTDIEVRLRSKLSTQSEKQRARRKTLEDDMKKSQGNKAKMYDKVSKMRKSYELKCKEHDKAKDDAAKATGVTKDKFDVRANKAVQAEKKADSEYKASLGELEEARRSWEVAMEKTCAEYEKMEKERLELERTLMWKTANMCSALAVISDQRAEEVRQMLEKSDPESDLAEFVAEKGTGSIRPEPMVHVAYAGRSNADVPPAVQAARNAASARSTGAASAATTTTSMGGPLGGGRSGAGAGSAGRSSTGSMGSSGSSTVTSTGRTFAASATAAAAQPLAPANGGGSETSTRPTVATENRNFQATFDYSPQGPKEMQLTKNDIVTVLDRSHKDWWKVQRGMKKGMVPANYLKPV